MDDFRKRQKALYREALEQPWWCEEHQTVHPGAPPVDRLKAGLPSFPEEDDG